MLVTWVPKKGAHHDDDGHTQASVCWAGPPPPASHHEHHVDRRPFGPKATLLLWQDVFPFAAVAESARDDFEEYFAGMRDKGNATIDTTLRPVFLLVSTLIVASLHCCGTTPPLHTATMIS